jgi:hypothetical protein
MPEFKRWIDAARLCRSRRAKEFQPGSRLVKSGRRRRSDDTSAHPLAVRQNQRRGQEPRQEDRSNCQDGSRMDRRFISKRSWSCFLREVDCRWNEPISAQFAVVAKDEADSHSGRKIIRLVIVISSGVFKIAVVKSIKSPSDQRWLEIIQASLPTHPPTIREVIKAMKIQEVSTLLPRNAFCRRLECPKTASCAQTRDFNGSPRQCPCSLECPHTASCAQARDYNVSPR